MSEETPPPKPARGGLPYSPGLRPRVVPKMDDLKNRLEEITGNPTFLGSGPAYSAPIGSGHPVEGLPKLLTRAVKGVHLQITFLQDGEPVLENEEFIVPVRPTWKIEGIGRFELKELLYIPKKELGSEDWADRAFQQCRPAFIASLEGTYPK